MGGIEMNSSKTLQSVPPKGIEETVTWSVIGDLECTKCQSLRFHRLKRSKWMRIFSKSILVQCKEC